MFVPFSEEKLPHFKNSEKQSNEALMREGMKRNSQSKNRCFKTKIKESV